MRTHNYFVSLVIALLVPIGCAQSDRSARGDQGLASRSRMSRRVQQMPPEEPRRAAAQIDPELDRALAEDNETEEAERKGLEEARREEANPARARTRKSWDVRMDRPLRSGSNQPTTGPSGSLPATPAPLGTQEASAPQAADVVLASMQQPSLKQITLRRDFVEKYKNRVTITSPARVVHAGAVHSAADDGDEHVAVLADEANLACCAEVMNAKNEPIVAEMKDAADHQDIVQLSGAWRLWCEHPGNDAHVQDDPIPPYTNSNPDHVFEIHPVHRAVMAGGTFDLENTLKPIAGYTGLKPASTFQTIYEKLPCHIESDSQTISIFTKGVGYNYAKYIMEIEDAQQFVTLDGRIVRCSVLDLQGNKLVGNRRMVFIKDTPPELAVKGLHKGDRLTVMGIPRINLAVVSWRVREADDRPEVLDWDLPYEMIVVAVFN